MDLFICDIFVAVGQALNFTKAAMRIAARRKGPDPSRFGSAPMSRRL
jgi:hypothetical protein